MAKMKSLSRSFTAAQSGVAATEFALILPAMAAAVIMLVDIANLAVGVSQMQTALRSTIQYAMNGGTDMSAAQSHGLAMWATRPSDGTLAVQQSCLCSGTAASCSEPCPDANPPEIYVTATASGTFPGNLISANRSSTEKVRLR